MADVYDLVKEPTLTGYDFRAALEAEAVVLAIKKHASKTDKEDGCHRSFYLDMSVLGEYDEYVRGSCVDYTLALGNERIKLHKVALIQGEGFKKLTPSYSERMGGLHDDKAGFPPAREHIFPQSLGPSAFMQFNFSYAQSDGTWRDAVMFVGRAGDSLICSGSLVHGSWPEISISLRRDNDNLSFSKKAFPKIASIVTGIRTLLGLETKANVAEYAN
ncbi:MAG: hypothetical protein HQM16_11745 [Deltaproteobacteria bacterium]|nr:hypothetical protein [Deltaproteobacteria bacterium]